MYRIYGFHEVVYENVKGVLVWDFTGEQTGIVRSLLKGRVIAVSTLLGRWMYTENRAK